MSVKEEIAYTGRVTDARWNDRAEEIACRHIEKAVGEIVMAIEAISYIKAIKDRSGAEGWVECRAAISIAKTILEKYR